MSAIPLPGSLRRFSAVLCVCFAALPNVTVGQQVVISAPDADLGLRASLEAASLLLRAPSDGSTRTGQDIVAAARAEYGRLIGVLYEAGYFAPTISIDLDGRDAARMSPFSAPARINMVEINIEPGAPFRLGRATIAPVAADTVLPDAFRPDGAASTPLLRATADAAIVGWQVRGHATAEIASQRIVARNPDAALDVDIRINPGPVVTFGTLIPQGHERMRPERIIAIAGLPQGDVYHPDSVARAEERLRDTGTFSSIRITGQDLQPGDVMDFEALVDEAPLRRLGFGVELSSDDGIGLSGYWLHRNLFGGAERLRFDASVSQIGIGTERPDVQLDLSFDRPATFNADTNLNILISGEWLDQPRYELAGVTSEVTLERWINPTLSVSAGLGVSQTEVDDALGSRSVTQLSFPLGAVYDNRDVPLDARAGAYAAADVRPFQTLGGDPGVWMYADARTYRRIGAGDGARFAARAQAGTIFGSDVTEFAPDDLFYSGGSGTVRGQQFQILGATQNGQASGGRSFAGLSGEFRYDLGETDFGLAGFLDAGFVSADAFGAGSSNWHAGAGVGLRYATPFGPIRVDLATPVSDGQFGSALYLYIGIGQAF